MPAIEIYTDEDGDKLSVLTGPNGPAAVRVTQEGEGSAVSVPQEDAVRVMFDLCKALDVSPADVAAYTPPERLVPVLLPEDFVRVVVEEHGTLGMAAKDALAKLDGGSDA